MKRIVRLTESDLVKLVKRVISEQQTQGTVKGPAMTTNDATILKDVINKTSGKKIISDNFVFEVQTTILFGTPTKPGITFDQQYRPNVSVTYNAGDSFNTSGSESIKTLHRFGKVFVDGKAIVGNGINQGMIVFDNVIV